MLMIAQDQDWDLHEKGVPHPPAPSWITTLAFKLEYLKESNDVLAHLPSFCDSVTAMSALEAWKWPIALGPRAHFAGLSKLALYKDSTACVADLEERRRAKHGMPGNLS
jgi:hypothetical protein